VTDLLRELSVTAALTYAYKTGILVCMRTTLNLKDDLVKKAQEMTGIKEKTALVHRGLELLIQQEAAHRLGKLKGYDPHATSGPRKRYFEK
jgi:Arc/MetJ family transcription regulator